MTNIADKSMINIKNQINKQQIDNSANYNNIIDLTIVIPHYNSPDLLCNLLDSIGFFQNLQIIVVDDKSNKKLDLFKDLQKRYNYIEFYCNDTDVKGAGRSRNIGLDHAKGKYVLFADADDLLLTDYYKMISQYFNKDYDIVYFLPTSKKSDGSLGSRHIEFANYIANYANHPNTKSELEIRYRTTAPWAKLISRECIEKHHIRFEETQYAEDVMFSVILAYYAKNITVCLQQLYCINEVIGSISSLGNDMSSEQTTAVLIRRYQFLKNHLSRKEFKILDLSALGRILLSLRCKSVSQKSKLNVIKMVLKARMRILPRKLFTLSFWKNRLSTH